MRRRSERERECVYVCVNERGTVTVNKKERERLTQEKNNKTKMSERAKKKELSKDYLLQVSSRVSQWGMGQLTFENKLIGLWSPALKR